MTKTKKLEILDLSDIKNLNNKNLTNKTNHYLQNLLFNMRIIFRHNTDNTDELTDLYHTIEELLKENRNPTETCLKNLIEKIVKTTLTGRYMGTPVILEPAGHLISSLYQEVEIRKLKIRKEAEPTFTQLADIINRKDCNQKIKDEIKKILKQNYPLLYAEYKARKNISHIT